MLIKKHNLSHSQIIIRQSLRLTIIPFLALYIAAPKEILVLSLGIITFLMVGLDLARHEFPFIHKTMTTIASPILLSSEKNIDNYHLTGASYLYISATMSLMVLPQSIFITSFMTFVISDLLATFVSTAIGRKPFFDKKLEGVMTYIVSATFLVIIAGIWMHVGWHHYVAGIIAAIVSSVIYGASSLLYANDNFIIPIGFGACMWALQAIATPM